MTCRSVLLTFTMAGLALAAGAPALAQAIQFDPAIISGGGTKQPAGLAAGDFNEDGHLDLVRTDPVDLNAQIFLGDGQGHLTRTSSFGSQNRPTAVAVGDVNHDGHLDLVLSAVAEPSLENVLLVALGNGDGTFQTTAQSYAAPSPFAQVVVADLNGDGFADVVAPFNQTSPVTTGIALYVNDGRGQLVEQPTIALGTSPVGVVVTDFTGDHVPDVAMVSTALWQNGASLIVFQGVGDGTFIGGQPYATSGPAGSIAAGDFTGDGIVDLVLSQGGSQGPNGLDLFVGTNDEAAFQRAVFTATPALGHIVGADLNRDGLPDIAAAGGDGLLTFEDDPEGNFEPPITFSLNGGPMVLMADLNGDGKADAITMFNSATSINVALNSSPAVALGPGQPIAWINPVNATVTGATLQKTGGCDGCFDASATSQQTIDGSVDSGVRYIAQQEQLLAFGLSSQPNPTTLDAIDYAIRPQGGVAEAREHGVYKGEVFFQDGDDLRVLVQGTTVRYLRNGAPFAVSAVPPSFPLRPAALIATAGGTIADAVVYGASTGGGGGGGTVTWGATDNVTVDGARIVKTSGCEGCFDGTAVAADAIEGDGFLEFTVDDTESLLIAGLTTAFTSGDPSSVDFGIRLQGGDAEIREHGAYKTDVLFHTGDIFRVDVTGGVVTYRLNGAVIYTSDDAPSGPLFAALSIASVGGSVSNVSVGGV